MIRAWLKEIDWDLIAEINRGLCEPKHALYRRSSDGYEATQRLWNENHARETTLHEAVELCRHCHRLAPFCNYNGNTFVAVIRTVINNISEFTLNEKALARSLAGHLVAGTASPEEDRQFRELLIQLDSKF